MEKWDVYDKYGNITGRIKAKNDVWNDGEYHLGASLWIISTNGDLLIQKRAATKKRWPNAWCNIGGSVIAGETSRQGCVREVEEEIGIKVCGDDLCFLRRSCFRDTICDDYIIIYDIPFEKVVIQLEEVSEVKWASIDEIKQLFAQGLFMIDNLSDIEKVIEYNNKRIRLKKC